MPHRFVICNASYKELRTVGIQFFMRLQKEQQIDNKQEIC